MVSIWDKLSPRSGILFVFSTKEAKYLWSQSWTFTLIRTNRPLLVLILLKFLKSKKQNMFFSTISMEKHRLLDFFHIQSEISKSKSIIRTLTRWKISKRPKPTFLSFIKENFTKEVDSDFRPISSLREISVWTLTTFSLTFIFSSSLVSLKLTRFWTNCLILWSCFSENRPKTKT